MLRAVENGLNRVLAHGEVAIDVFDFDCGIVDKDADGEREAAQGHDVDSLAEGAEEENANENRKRDRDENDERALPVAEEEKNHDDGEAGGDEAFAENALDRCANEERLIEKLVDLEARRIGGLVVSEHVFEPIDDAKCGGVACFVDAHQDAALAVGDDDVCLRRETVADVGDVAQISCGAVDRFYRKVVQLVDALRAAVHFHGVFELAEFCGAGGKNQVLIGDGVDDVHGRKAVRLESRGIRINRDEALFAAVRKRSCRALDGCELRANKIVAEIEELLLAQRVASEAELDDGHSGGGIDNDERRSGAGRQEAEKSLRDGGGLGESRLNIRVRLEIDFDHGDARQRLRFDMFDVVDKRGNSALDVAGDALFHFLGLQPAVSPDETDNGNIDFGEDVRGRAGHDYERHQDDDEGHHDKRIRPLKR